MANTNKTNYLVFSYKRKLFLSKIKKKKFDSHKIESTKFSDVFLDENLTFKDHINFLRTKIYKWVGTLYKLNLILPKEICIKLYNSFVESYSGYHSEV